MLLLDVMVERQHCCSVNIALVTRDPKSCACLNPASPLISGRASAAPDHVPMDAFWGLAVISAKSRGATHGRSTSCRHLPRLGEISLNTLSKVSNSCPIQVHSRNQNHRWSANHKRAPSDAYHHDVLHNSRPNVCRKLIILVSRLVHALTRVKRLRKGEVDFVTLRCAMLKLWHATPVCCSIIQLYFGLAIHRVSVSTRLAAGATGSVAQLDVLVRPSQLWDLPRSHAEESVHEPCRQHVDCQCDLVRRRVRHGAQDRCSYKRSCDEGTARHA